MALQNLQQATRDNQAVVAVYPSHDLAEQAILALQKAGYDMKKLSIIGNDDHNEEHVVGFYNMGERAASWGKTGAFWGGMWGSLVGFLFGTGLFFIPGLGPMFVAGPFLAWLVGGLEGAVVVGGLSALGAALYSMGIPKDHVLQYETDLRAGKFVLIAHGSRETVLQAKRILDVNAHQYEIAQAAAQHPVMAPMV